jgi:hypothetical protein
MLSANGVHFVLWLALASVITPVHIGILTDIDHSVQEPGAFSLSARGQNDQNWARLERSYCRTGGVVGQGEAACAGIAEVVEEGVAAAVGFGRAAGFFAVGLLAGFLVGFDGGGAGLSSTTTGFGVSRGGSPVS